MVVWRGTVNPGQEGEFKVKAKLDAEDYYNCLAT